MSEGRAKKSFYNMVSGFVYQLVMLILSFVSRSVFIYSLGTEYLGLNGIFTDVLTLLSMADLGFGTAMAYSFYKPLADHDEEMLASLIGFYRKVYNLIAIAVSVIGIACIPFIRFIVNVENDIPHLEIYYLFSLANVVISYLFVYKTTLMTADQKNYKLVNIRMWTSLAKTVFQIAVLLLFKSYILYLAIGVINQFLCNLISSLITEKEYPYIKKDNRKLIDENVKNNIIKNMKSMFIYQASGTLFNGTDNILISKIVSTAITGLYSNYLMLSNKLLLMEQIIFSAVTASLGNIVVVENEEKRYKVFQSLQSVSFIFCGIITSGFAVLANDVILIWLGEEYLLSRNTIFAISLNTYFSCVLQPLWSYRQATGLYLKTKYIMLIASVINIVLSIILGLKIGITGIILASAIARLSTYFWYEPKILFKDYFNRDVKGYYISIFINMILVITSVAVLSFVTRNFKINTWLELLYKAVGVGICCVIVFITSYCKTEGFQMIMNKCKLIVNRKSAK